MSTFVDEKTGEIVEGNEPFIQLYRENLRAVNKLVEINSLAARLFLFLVEKMDNRNALIVSHLTLSEVLNVTERSTYTAVKFLVENNYIKIVKTGSTNIYCINANIVWTQRADKRSFAEFTAKVYLGSTEQVEKPKVKTEFRKVAKIKEEKKKIKAMPDAFEAGS